MIRKLAVTVGIAAAVLIPAQAAMAHQAHPAHVWHHPASVQMSPDPVFPHVPVPSGVHTTSPVGATPAPIPGPIYAH